MCEGGLSPDPTSTHWCEVGRVPHTWPPLAPSLAR